MKNVMKLLRGFLEKHRDLLEDMQQFFGIIVLIFLPFYDLYLNIFQRKLIKSGYGQSFGWYIEFDGKAVGELVDYRWEEMFWASHKVIPYENEESGSPLFDNDNWFECKFTYRNKEFPKKSITALSGPYMVDGRISMRGLYL